jgi:hypothetical protein
MDIEDKREMPLALNCPQCTEGEGPFMGETLPVSSG